MTRLRIPHAITLGLALSACMTDEVDLLSDEAAIDIPVVPTGIETAGVLGQGRDVVTEEFRADCVRSATTITTPLQESSLRFGSSLLREEASELLGYSVDAKARYKLVSGSARARFSRSLTTSSLSVGMFYMADYRMGIDRLDQANLQWIVPPGSPDWINRCGDHVLLQRERGGQLHLLYRIDFSSLAAKQEFEGSVGVNFPAGEVNATVNRSASRFVNRASVHVEAFQVGGDVTRLSSILGGGGSDSAAGRVVIECSMNNLAPCGTFMQNAINYASAQTPGSFSDTLRSSPADRTYLFKDWSILGVSIPTRAVPAAVRTARFDLRQRFDRQVEFADRVAVLKSGTLYVTPGLRALLDSYSIAVQRNLDLLTDAAADCYDHLVDPASSALIAACTDGASLPVLVARGYDVSLTMDKLVVDARLPYAFGGMYQVTEFGNVRRDVANPLTGGLGCPAGFTAHLYGRSGAQWFGRFGVTGVGHYVCLAPNTVAGGGWDFTGAFQDDGNGNAYVANRFGGSDGATCAPGTGTPRIHGWGLAGSLAGLSNHRFCSTGTRSNDRASMGGVFQRAAGCGPSFANPMTGAVSCPEGFSEVAMATVAWTDNIRCPATQYVCKPL
jgi:hypothetical protein